MLAACWGEGLLARVVFPTEVFAAIKYELLNRHMKISCSSSVSYMYVRQYSSGEVFFYSRFCMHCSFCWRGDLSVRWWSVCRACWVRCAADRRVRLWQ